MTPLWVKDRVGTPRGTFQGLRPKAISQHPRGITHGRCHCAYWASLHHSLLQAETELLAKAAGIGIEDGLGMAKAAEHGQYVLQLCEG